MRYDLGEYDAVDVIVSSLWTLLFEKRNQTPILRHLDEMPTDMMDSRIPSDTVNVAGPYLLLGAIPYQGSYYTPLLDGIQGDPESARVKVPLEQWWDAPAIRDEQGNEFSRRLLISTMRDKEVHHIDAGLLPPYMDLQYRQGLGIHRWLPDGVSSNGDSQPARVAVRQIAHEFLRTVDPVFPQCHGFSPDNPPTPLVRLLASHPDGSPFSTEEYRGAFDITILQTSSSALFASPRKTAKVMRERALKSVSPSTARSPETGAVRIGLENFGASGWHFEAMISQSRKGERLCLTIVVLLQKLPVQPFGQSLATYTGLLKKLGTGGIRGFQGSLKPNPRASSTVAP
ncbi:hypothetical protein [Aquabacterium sp.]|uniref:hypothetical protein n=1 Tax=Aquabacterium sp. TaxID=1872578 RepID=UPI003D6CB923